MEIGTTQAFLDYYGKLRERTNRLVDLITPEMMDWSYRPGKYTIADMLRHIAAIERNMFAENILLRPSAYHGCGPDLASGHQEVIDFFQEMHRQSIAIFESLSPADLQRKCPFPGGQVTTWKWLRALTEHEIHHRGELYIYLNLQGVRTPPMFGMTAEQLQAQNP